MKIVIHRIEITQDQINACLKRMEAAPFKAADIERVAESCGVPHFENQEFIAHRVADRLIQNLRKSGKITVGAPYPTWNHV